MELWAAVDEDGTTNLYSGVFEWDSEYHHWTCGKEGDCLACDETLSILACRDVKPGEKRKLTKFDPINEIVEYEDTLEQRHQRLVDAAIRLSRDYELNPARIVFLEDFYSFLRSEGYIN